MERILVIEDEVEIQANIQDLLEIHGYEVLTAGDGRAGINSVISSSPDLIICDINMPIMNGLDLIKELKQYPEFYTIPFLFLTANASQDSVRIGMGLGADDYITKPYKSSELVEAVEVRLEKSKKLKELFLTKIEELKKNISFSIPHELRTPLNAIMGFSKLLMGNVKDFDSSEMENIIGHIHDSGARLLRLIENYTYLNNFISNSITAENIKEPHTTEPSVVIKKAVLNAVKHYAKNLSPLFDLCNDKVLQINEEYFYKLVFEIADNACKFSDEDKQVKVVSIYSKDFFIVKIENYGRGMDKNEIKDVDAFMQFGREEYEQQGLGLGLAIVKKILGTIGGKLQIDSVLYDFTAVRIYIPLAQTS
ncbi:MAG: response regulator [Candidatus Kapaibacterium sp.]